MELDDESLKKVVGGLDIPNPFAATVKSNNDREDADLGGAISGGSLRNKNRR